MASPGRTSRTLQWPPGSPLGSELTHHRLQDSRADQDEIHPHSNVEQPGSWRTGQGQRNRAIPLEAEAPRLDGVAIHLPTFWLVTTNPAFTAWQLGRSVQVLLSTYAKWLNSANDWTELAKLEKNVMGTGLNIVHFAPFRHKAFDSNSAILQNASVLGGKPLHSQRHTNF